MHIWMAAGMPTLMIFLSISMCRCMFFMLSLMGPSSWKSIQSTRAQEISQEIAMLELQNDAVNVEIAQLSSADRIYEIAANNGLTRNSGNVISITNGENGD